MYWEDFIWGDFLTVEDAIISNKRGGKTIHDADDNTITIGEDE